MDWKDNPMGPPEYTEFGLPAEHSEFGLSGEHTEFGLAACPTEFGIESEHTEFHAACTGNGAGPMRLVNGHVEALPAVKPLRVIHVGQFLFRAGIESWLKSLVRFADKRRLQILRCVVT